MCGGRIRFQGFHHALQRNPQDAPHRQRGHQVLSIMRATNQTMVDIQKRARPAVDPAEQKAPVQVNVRPSVGGAERDDFGRDIQPERAQLGEGFTLNNGPIEGLLVGK